MLEKRLFSKIIKYFVNNVFLYRVNIDDLKAKVANSLKELRISESRMQNYIRPLLVVLTVP